MRTTKLARLALEDGTVFHGRAFGGSLRTTSDSVSATAACDGEAGFEGAGEVVFNTSMVGYQEALTDLSYTGQILTMTATQMGNYGVAPEDIESASPCVAGFVVRELSQIVSNQRATQSLSDWLEKAGIPAIEGIDTRALVRRLRMGGAMRGVISSASLAEVSDLELVARARAIPSMAGANLAAKVSPRCAGRAEEALGEWAPRGGHFVAESDAADSIHPNRSGQRFKVVAIDCGAKRNIYRHLVERNCEVHFVPHSATVAEIRAMKPDGLFISNGPGDPAVVHGVIETLRVLAGEVPTFGICLGHQLLALALGATTWKLKFGHRGANQPVRNVLTGRIEITSQNHGFCVDEASLRAAGGEPTHLHLNDGTLAGFRHTTKPIFSVQYHPEASPGPHDSAYLFDVFIEMMTTRKPVGAAEMERAQAAMAAV
ncbi:MAG: carbamoyl-phosphate synthase small subunit [Planctomycetota bacterium]|jgi:carbamoyl-phosphate synthase small subunit|nr:MAG: carbamoyl-phosphate synthase small subunit [Planctomycetota bacterium]